MGFIEKEIYDFKKAWIPRLSDSPYYLIDFLVNEELEKYAPLKTIPDLKMLRAYMVYKPVKTKNVSYTRKEIRSMERPKGDILVEWGGMEWSRDETFR